MFACRNRRSPSTSRCCATVASSRRGCSDAWRILGGASTADPSQRARSSRRLRRRARRHGPRQASSCGHSAGRTAEVAARGRAERRARGLREDGVLFWVSEEDGSLSTDINEHARHLATIRGPELFPELAFLKPTSAPDSIVCWSCGGSGSVVPQGHELDNIRCLCGGMGKLPPQLADLLRARS